MMAENYILSHLGHGINRNVSPKDRFESKIASFFGPHKVLKLQRPFPQLKSLYLNFKIIISWIVRNTDNKKNQNKFKEEIKCDFDMCIGWFMYTVNFAKYCLLLSVHIICTTLKNGIWKSYITLIHISYSLSHQQLFFTL